MWVWLRWEWKKKREGHFCLIKSWKYFFCPFFLRADVHEIGLFIPSIGEVRGHISSGVAVLPKQVKLTRTWSIRETVRPVIGYIQTGVVPRSSKKSWNQLFFLPFHLENIFKINVFLRPPRVKLTKYKYGTTQLFVHHFRKKASTPSLKEYQDMCSTVETILFIVDIKILKRSTLVNIGGTKHWSDTFWI